MPPKFAYYGFGNYLVDEDVLGSLMVFIMAEDDKAARSLVVQLVAKAGEVVPGSIVVTRGNKIAPSWLMGALMEKEDALWSSGSIVAKQPTQEYLN